MEREKRPVWQVLVWDWGYLLCFELAHKMAGFLLLLPLFRGMSARMLRTSELETVTKQTLRAMTESPAAAVVSFLWLLLFLWYFYFEMMTLTLACERAWRRESSSFLKLLGKAFLRSVRLFRWAHLPLILGLTAALPVLMAPFTGNMGIAGQIVTSFLSLAQEHSWVWGLFVLLILLLAAALFWFLFGFQAMADGANFSQAWESSCSILRRHKKQALNQVVRYFLRIGLGALVLYLVAVYITAGVANFRYDTDEARLVFQLDYLAWSRLGRIGVFVLFSVVFFALTTVLYHRFRGDRQPQGKQRRRLSQILRLVSIALGLAALAIFSETELGGQVFYWPETQIQVVAHRGGAQLAPENTLAALRAAKASGSAIAEIDIRQTSDGTLILLHDTSLRRTTGYDAQVWDVTYEDVQKLNLVEPIPTLDEAIKVAGKKLDLMIELKVTGNERSLVERTVALIRKNQAEERCSIASMDLETLERVKEIAPEIKTIYITSLLYGDQYNIDYVDGYSIQYTFLNPLLVSQIHAAGKEAYTWTANSEWGIRRAIYCQPDGIVTDNPYLVQYFLESGDQSLLLEFWTPVFFGYPTAPAVMLDEVNDLLE